MTMLTKWTSHVSYRLKKKPIKAYTFTTEAREGTDETNKFGKVKNLVADGTRSGELIEDPLRLTDNLSKETVINTASADKPTSIEIYEIKLEPAMLRATVNSLQEKCIRAVASSIIGLIFIYSSSQTIE